MDAMRTPGMPDYPPPPGWSDRPPPVERGRNGLAIAGLVLGIIPIFAGILGIVFGLVGRSQARANGQRGRVMGTWGAALGAAWLMVIVAAVAIDFGNDAERDDNGQVVSSGQESSFELHVGDCLKTVPADSSTVSDVDLVNCRLQHKGEVYAQLTVTYPSYPGEKAMTSRAERLCTSAFAPYVGKSYDDSTLDVFYLYPTARSWRAADRGVTCLLDAPGVSSAKGSHR